MNTQKTKKGLYPLETKLVELREAADSTRKLVRGIESELSSDEGSVTKYPEKEKDLREAEDLLADMREGLERVTRLIEGNEDLAREVTREDAREMILALFHQKGQLGYSEIMSTLSLDLELIVEICAELEADSKIEGVD